MIVVDTNVIAYFAGSRRKNETSVYFLLHRCVEYILLKFGRKSIHSYWSSYTENRLPVDDMCFGKIILTFLQHTYIRIWWKSKTNVSFYLERTFSLLHRGQVFPLTQPDLVTLLQHFNTQIIALT